MHTHYYHYLKYKNFKNLNHIDEIEQQSFSNIKKFNYDYGHILYTHIDCRDNENNDWNLHIIFQGFDLSGSSHLYTAWDMVLSEYLKERSNNTSFLVISPITSLGNYFNRDINEYIKKNGIIGICEIYKSAIDQFIKSSSYSYSKIIFHGISGGCVIANELSKSFSNSSVILDNPTFFFNNSLFSIPKIFFAFIFEGIYRVIFDERVYIPLKYEKEIREYIAKYSKYIPTRDRILTTLKLLKIYRAYPTNYELVERQKRIINIGEFDYTLQPINRNIIMNNDINILGQQGHYIDRFDI